MAGVDDARIGEAFRTLRVRRGWRQADVALRSGVPRDVVGRLEHGRLDRCPLGQVRSVALALGLRVDIVIRWPGGDLDRVLNAGHAALHEAIGRLLGNLDGWTFAQEVSYAIFGERGVIDVLAWHAATRSLLIIELKSRLVDPQELVGTMDRRLRLATRIARERGWLPLTVSTWVVLTDTRTNRRRVAAHPILLRSRFPADGRAVRGWLRRPSGAMHALSFWTDVGPGRTPSASRRSSAARGAR